MAASAAIFVSRAAKVSDTQLNLTDFTSDTNSFSLTCFYSFSY
jgi:hypothetical protein